MIYCTDLLINKVSYSLFVCYLFTQIFSDTCKCDTTNSDDTQPNCVYNWFCPPLHISYKLKTNTYLHHGSNQLLAPSCEPFVHYIYFLLDFFTLIIETLMGNIHVHLFSSNTVNLLRTNCFTQTDGIRPSTVRTV